MVASDKTAQSIAQTRAAKQRRRRAAAEFADSVNTHKH
jgi:hypothetical protein